MVNAFKELSSTDQFGTIKILQTNSKYAECAKETFDILKMALSERDRQLVDTLTYTASRDLDKLPVIDGREKQRIAGANYFFMNPRSDASKDAIQRCIEKTTEHVDRQQKLNIQANNSSGFRSQEEQEIYRSFVQMSIGEQLRTLLEFGGFAQEADKAKKDLDREGYLNRLRNAILNLRTTPVDYQTTLFEKLLEAQNDNEVFFTAYTEFLVEGTPAAKLMTLREVSLPDLLAVIEQMQKELVAMSTSSSGSTTSETLPLSSTSTAPGSTSTMTTSSSGSITSDLLSASSTSTVTTSSIAPSSTTSTMTTSSSESSTTSSTS